MFRIRRIYDETRQVDKTSIGQVLDIMRSHFSSLSERKINEVYEQLRNQKITLLKNRYENWFLL